MQEIRTRSPGLKVGDGRPDLVDDADALVAENAAGLAGRHVALEDMQIGAADRRLDDLDDRVGGRRDFRLGVIFQGLLVRALDKREPSLFRLLRLWREFLVLASSRES